MPSRFRFSAMTATISYIFVSVLVLALFATPIIYAWDEIIQERSTERLGEDATRLANVLQRHGTEALKAVIDTLVEAQAKDDEKFILLSDAALTPVAGNLQAWPQDLPMASGTYTASFDLGRRNIRAIFVRTALPGGYNLIVGRNVAKSQSVKTLFWVGLIGAGWSVLLFGALGGFLIRSALLAEVQKMRQTAAAIVAGDLSRRLATQGEADELDKLAQTVNTMLDQIEHLIHGIRNVSNSIAHDLRTPLAELRSRLEELTLSRPSPGETFSEIECAVADVDRVIMIFNALLRLAEIDNRTRRSGFVPVDIAMIVDNAVEYYLPFAESKGIALTAKSMCQVAAVGDHMLLTQALSNLIENAMKYALHNISITVQTSGETVDISVADDGPGIAEDEKQKVIERFYRGDASRGTPGVGLGLSLVAAVAKLHGGALELTDAHPGLRATLCL